jgi:Zn-dependent protease/CBS domain-containing protein
MTSKSSIPLGRIFNIPIGLDYSWFLIFALLTWSLASSYFPAEFKNWPIVQYWVIGAITAGMLFVSVLLHELGHSVVALRYKVPVKSITLFIFGGVAQIGSEPPTAAAEFWIAIAGPIVSFLLAGLFGLLQLATAGFSPLLAIAQYLALLNGSLALFNLIPGFPLDGGRVLRAILWGTSHNFQKATRISATIGRIIAFGFILFGVFQIFTGNLGGGLWIAFIGWFLDSAASSQLQQQNLQEMLIGFTASQAMSRDYVILNPDTTLQQLVSQPYLIQGRKYFIVEDQGRLAGFLTPIQLKQAPRDTWATTRIDQIMIPLDQVHIVHPETDLWDAIKEMDLDGVNQLPVMSDGSFMGLLSRENILRFLRNLKKNRFDQPTF